MSLYASVKYAKTYRVFISHPWSYTKGYNRLVSLLNAAPRFNWANYSAPRAAPAVNRGTEVGRRALKKALKDQIRPVHCVLIMSGMYASYREWIQAEIDISTEFGKPIVGIRPWGQQRTPVAVSDVADEMAGWNTATIVAAIRKHSL